MKLTLALAVILVAVAAVCASTDLSTTPETSLIEVGTPVARNRLVHRRQFIRYAAANTVHIHDHTWLGSTVITSVRAYEVGASQGASARITSGGVGSTRVTVRLQSLRGRGFNIILEVYAR